MTNKKMKKGWKYRKKKEKKQYTLISKNFLTFVCMWMRFDVLESDEEI